MTTSDNPGKLDLFQELLYHGLVKAAINVSYPGVFLPRHITESGPCTVLSYGYVTTSNIPDLRITRAGIYATLSFPEAQVTFVPWGAIFSLICDSLDLGVWYEEDVPEVIDTKPQPVLTLVTQNEELLGLVPQEAIRPTLRLVDTL